MNQWVDGVLSLIIYSIELPNLKGGVAMATSLSDAGRISDLGSVGTIDIKTYLV